MRSLGSNGFSPGKLPAIAFSAVSVNSVSGKKTRQERQVREGKRLLETFQLSLILT